MEGIPQTDIKIQLIMFLRGVPMGKIKLKARAKINLTLDILGKRADGYHEVEMVMQTIELYDVLVIKETARGIEITTSHPLVPAGSSNIAYQAAKMMADKYGINRGVKIDIKKNIPVAAGLGGGSSDAAAVLKGLNCFWGLGLAQEILQEMAAVIGSDVPFCIRGGTALAQGRGEVLSALPDVPVIWLVLAKPPLEVSTSEIYQHYDPLRVGQRPQTNEMVNAVREGNINGIIQNLANVLESVTFNRYPGVLRLKQAMDEAGARRSLMSGSGPSVFGVAQTREQAEEIAGNIGKRFPEMFVQITRTWPAE